MTTVLVVDDEPSLVRDVKFVLEAEGYRVLTAEDGQAALNILEVDWQRPDLVLCDITMPNMDGNALLKVIKAMHPNWWDIPFVFLTANGMVEHKMRGRIAGAADYLVKPVAFDHLLGVVKRLTGGPVV